MERLKISEQLEQMKLGDIIYIKNHNYTEIFDGFGFETSPDDKDGVIEYQVLRVFNGWMYTYLGAENSSSIFVPR